MTYENISVRVDSDTKKQFNSFCLSVGLTPATAITMYIKKVINEHRIPFEISNNINISNDDEYFNEDDRFIVLNPYGSLLSFNKVGYEILKLCDGFNTESEIVKKIEDIYEIDSSVLEKDINLCIQQLMLGRLVRYND